MGWAGVEFGLELSVVGNQSPNCYFFSLLLCTGSVLSLCSNFARPLFPVDNDIMPVPFQFVLLVNHGTNHSAALPVFLQQISSLHNQPASVFARVFFVDGTYILFLIFVVRDNGRRPLVLLTNAHFFFVFYFFRNQEHAPEEDNRRAIQTLLAEVYGLEGWASVWAGYCVYLSAATGDSSKAPGLLHVPAGIQDSRSNPRGQAHPCQIYWIGSH
jgi:hypothetical protein